MYLILWTSMKFSNSMWQYDVRRNDITVHEAWYHFNTRHIIVRFTCVHMWPFLDGMNLDHNLVFVWLTYSCPCQITLCSAGTSLELLCNKYPHYNTYYWVYDPQFRWLPIFWSRENIFLQILMKIVIDATIMMLRRCVIQRKSIVPMESFIWGQLKCKC